MHKHLKKSRRSPLWAIAAALLLAAALVYLGGVYYFRSHFPFQTSFMGEDVSQQPVQVIDELLAAESAAQQLTIHEKDGSTETLQLSSAIDYRLSVAAPQEGWIPSDTSWAWPQSLFSPTELTGQEEIDYSAERLGEAVASLEAMDPENVTEPRDAYIQWEDGKCFIVPEEDGNQLSFEKVFSVIQAAVEAGQDWVDLEASGCYNTATIRRDDEELNAYVALYEAIGFQEITLDMTGVQIILTPDDVLSFYREGDPESGLDEDRIRAYVADLKAQYDTYEQQRPFTDHYGQEILAGTWADTYGFKMDLDATAALLTETLESKQTAEIAPVWINAGWVREENGSDIGDTYIEVSISEQHLWAYVDGEQILDTDVVTGNTGNHDTPRGVFRIMGKARDTYLTGTGYRSFVNYWMQITRDGVGLHDASWRSYFGGNIYTYSGSHGCVNMPYWAAQQVYNSFSGGTPVVIW